MSLRRRVLLGCLLVAAVLLATDTVLASTFRSFLLGRVDQQVIQAADPLVHGRFPGRFGGPRLPTGFRAAARKSDDPDEEPTVKMRNESGERDSAGFVGRSGRGRPVSP